MLHGGGVYFTPSYESFISPLTTVQIENAIAEYQKLGLFSHLSSVEISKAKEKVYEQENVLFRNVLEAFPNVIYSFDAELGNLEDPYAELLREFSVISRGVFKPQNITDEFPSSLKNKKALVKFTINEKEYSMELPPETDWVESAFFDLVNQALADNKVNGKFHDLYTGDQIASIIFLTAEQAEYLRTNKLLLFGDQWEEAEEY
jgi:hypothetical protein